MKKLFLILFLLLFTSCDSIEKKIIHSYNFQRSENLNTKAISAKIYDTLYFHEVNKNIINVQKQYKETHFEIRRIKIYQSNINRFTYPSPLRDSITKRNTVRINFLEKELERLSYKESVNEQLITQVDNDIAAYYTKIITRKDTLYFFVTPLTYMIICPVDMINDNF